MRIAILTQYFEPEIGAPQVRYTNFINQLKENNCKIEVVTGMPNHPVGEIYNGYKGCFYKKEIQSNLVIHRVWLYASTGKSLKRLFSYLSFCITSIYGLLKIKKPQFLIVESPPLFIGITAICYSKIFNVPYIFNVADLWPDSILEMKMIKKGFFYLCLLWIEKYIYKNAKYVNAVTVGIKYKLINQKKVNPKKILFLPNGVDTDIFNPNKDKNDQILSKLGLQDKKIIIYAGTIGYAQNLDILLLASKQLESTHPDIVTIIIGDGPEKPRLLKLLKKESIRNVYFLESGTYQYVAKLMSLSWAGFVSLRDIELFYGARPSKLFPIMSSALPVILSAKGESADLIEKAKAGVISAPDDVDDLVRNIKYLYSLNDNTFGINGRNYVIKYLSWKKIVKEWLEELNKRNKDDK
ncbi:MAG: glycosyltransferase family 4 protein [Bdellovibrionales bacterium]|nr:glycosyltransferase family 4 protein [Bdellovibrionales bacterium]